MARLNKIPPQQITTIMQLYKDGNSTRDIEKLIKSCSRSTIARIIKSQEITTPEGLIKEATRKAKQELRKMTQREKDKAIQTIATVQAVKDTEQATSPSFTEEFEKTKAQMKKLLSLANTNHTDSILLISRVMKNVAKKVEIHGEHINMADNKRVMEILDLGTDITGKVFNNLGFDVRNELIQLSMRKDDERHIALVQWVNSKGEIIDEYEDE